MNIQILIIILAAGLLVMAAISIASNKPGGGGRSRRSSGAGTGTRNAAFKLNVADMRARWEQIMAVSKTGGSGMKSAIMDADKLLDHALKARGYSGETMGDRLRSANKQFTDRNAVWRAHKLRNTLAHEIGFDLVPSQIREALRDFERALRDLSAL